MAIRTKPKDQATRHAGIIQPDHEEQLEELNSTASFEAFAPIGSQLADKSRCHLHDRTTKQIWLTAEAADNRQALEAALADAKKNPEKRPATTAMGVMDENKKLKEEIAKLKAAATSGGAAAKGKNVGEPAGAKPA
jgi:hypothetical protein